MRYLGFTTEFLESGLQNVRKPVCLYFEPAQLCMDTKHSVMHLKTSISEFYTGCDIMRYLGFTTEFLFSGIQNVRKPVCMYLAPAELRPEFKQSVSRQETSISEFKACCDIMRYPGFSIEFLKSGIQNVR